MFEIGTFGVFIRGTEVTPEYVYDLWVNSRIAHPDPDKARELNELLQDTLPFAEMQFLAVLPKLTHIILFVGAVINKGFDDHLFNFPTTLTQQ
jgi:hypothetical protein